MKLPVLEQSLVLRDPSIPSFSSLLILQLNNIYVSHILFTNVISWYSHVHSRIHPMNKSQTGNSLFYISKFMLPDINNHSYLTAFFHQSCLSPKLIIFQWNKGVAEEFTTTWARDELHWSSESQMYNWYQITYACFSHGTCSTKIYILHLTSFWLIVINFEDSIASKNSFVQLSWLYDNFAPKIFSLIGWN